MAKELGPFYQNGEPSTCIDQKGIVGILFQQKIDRVVVASGNARLVIPGETLRAIGSLDEVKKARVIEGMSRAIRDSDSVSIFSKK